MPEIQLIVDDSRLIARLDRITPDVHAALAKALGPLAQEIAADVRALARRKTGQFLASIYGGVFDKGERIGGYVRSGDPVAHLLEEGTGERFRATMRSAREVLGALGTGSTGAMPPFPAFGQAFEGAEGRIRDAIEGAVKGAVQ